MFISVIPFGRQCLPPLPYPVTVIAKIPERGDGVQSMADASPVALKISLSFRSR
jgi:hypothetical protein